MEAKVISFQEFKARTQDKLLEEFRAQSDGIAEQINIKDFYKEKRHKRITQMILDKYEDS